MSLTNKYFTTLVALLLTSAALFVPAPAQAMARLDLLGVGNFMKTHSAGYTDPSPEFSPGAGVLLEVPFGFATGLEFGGLYAPRRYQTGGTRTDVTMIDIPVLLRLNFFPFSLGAGGYYSKVSGTQVAGTKNADYGLEGAVGLRAALGMMTDLYLEGRYLYGLDNVSTAGAAKVNWRGVQTLLGLSFHL